MLEPYKCPVCLMVSFSADDARAQFCANCHAYDIDRADTIAMLHEMRRTRLGRARLLLFHAQQIYPRLRQRTHASPAVAAWYAARIAYDKGLCGRITARGPYN